MNKDILELLKENKLKKASLPEKRTNLLDILRQSRIKLTQERKEIISILERAEFPLSPAELFLRIKPTLPKANLTTIYRNLEMLEGLNLVKRLAFNKNNFSYELVTNRAHHHHAICKNCGKVEDLENISEKFVIEVSKTTEFNIEDHNLEFFGVCQECMKKILQNRGINLRKAL